MLTQRRLKTLIHYNTETGIITALIKRGSRCQPGKILNTRSGDGRYIYIGIEGKNYLAHRLAWLYVYGEWPKEIDHANRDGLDNRIQNLRKATRSQNQINKPRRNGVAGSKGVVIDRGSKTDPRPARYHARIGYKGQKLSCGYFKTLEEASAAYAAKAKQLYGDFAS
jgi:hypothetical protein